MRKQENKDKREKRSSVDQEIEQDCTRHKGHQEPEGGKPKPVEPRSREEIYMYQAKLSTVVGGFFENDLLEEVLIKTTE